MAKQREFMRTYRYRLYPARSQEQNLWRVLDACRGLYNLALAERKYAYQLEGRSVSKTDPRPIFPPHS